MKQDENFYEVLKEELNDVLNVIINERELLLSKSKPIDRPDTKYSNRITSCIMYYSNKVRRFEDDELATYYKNEENAQWELDKILEINHFINCKKGVDYALSKKIVCVILGLSIEQYQTILTSYTPTAKIFQNIEEYLIAIRQEGAETFTRNSIAVDTNLKTKSQFGGFDVEAKNSKENKTLLKFDPNTASVEELKKHLLEFEE